MNAVFIIRSSFPVGVAYSSRARHISLLLNELGYNVHVICAKGKSQNSESFNNGRITISRVTDPRNILTLCGIGTYVPYMEALIEYGKKNSIDLILSSGIEFVTDHILRYAHEKNIPFILEQCEWYDKSTFKFGNMNPYYRHHLKRIKTQNRKVDGIIAISRLFYDHYTNQGVKCIRIPTILDKNNTIYRNEGFKDNDIHLVFAGSLGKGKELLKPIFEALNQLIQDTELRSKIALCGYDTVKSAFSLDKWKQKWARVIERHCGNTTKEMA